MEDLQPTRPTDPAAALMENELLRYEVRHLRARLAAADTTSGDRQDGQFARRNARAFDDVVWLVGRLDRSPVGGLLRRWQGFRVLRSRYLPGTES